MSDCTNCPYKDRIERTEKDIQDLQKDQKSNIETQIETKVLLNSFIDNSTKYQEESKKSMKDLNDKIDKLGEKPAKRWDTVINTAISSVISILVASIMALIIINK